MSGGESMRQSAPFIGLPFSWPFLQTGPGAGAHLSIGKDVPPEAMVARLRSAFVRFQCQGRASPVDVRGPARLSQRDSWTQAMAMVCP
jgi:hypothetical protein